VVVDQLRPDLLERCEPVLTGGFRRLRERGFRFASASHRHALTETVPGRVTSVDAVQSKGRGRGHVYWIGEDGLFTTSAH